MGGVDAANGRAASDKASLGPPRGQLRLLLIKATPFRLVVREQYVRAYLMKSFLEMIRPTSPEASKNRDAGSGTSDGGSTKA